MSYTLKIAGKSQVVDYPAIIASSLINGEKADSINVVYEGGKVIEGTKATSQLLKDDSVVASSATDILNALADAFPDIILEKEASGKWVKFGFEKLTVRNFKALSEDLAKLDAHLNFRTFIIGYKITLADIAAWGCLRANPVMGSVIRNAVYINVSRWYQFLESDNRFDGAASAVNKALSELKKEAKHKKGKKVHMANFDIDLPNAVDGKVVTRFPPEPSGYMHIGHAKAAILNDYIAKAYHGKLIIRFDDTNPSKETTEFEDAILEDCKRLGIVGDKVTHSSDYFDKMYEYAIQMIKEGKAYCDDTPLEQMRAERMDGIKSARRDRTVEENLHIFTEEMKNATEEGQKNCLRAKIDYKNPNKALRDPTIYRCNLTPHQRTGSQWKMYPIYDFCVPIVDSLEGVTHAFRTIEYRDRNPQYYWMLDALHLRKVYVWDFARVNFVRTLLSKRKLQWFVDRNLVSGWNDPRFPTVRGVMRRGMTVEGLRNFILGQGPSKNIINLDWDIIWSSNRKVIDPIAPRLTALDKQNIVPTTLTNGPELHAVEKPKHKKNPKLGTKNVWYSSNILLEQNDAKDLKEGEEVTLMDWGNCVIEKIEKDDSGIVKAIAAKLHLEGDFKKTKKKLTWLTAEKTTPVTLKDFDHLITKDKLDEGDNFEDFLTPKTEFTAIALADANVNDLKVNDIIQFERKAFFRLDSDKNGERVFFSIPDGRNKVRL